MTNLRWSFSTGRAGGASSYPIGPYVIVIRNNYYRLLKKSLDGRRVVVIKQYYSTDIKDIIVRLNPNTTPLDETKKFLQSCEKYIKLN